MIKMMSLLATLFFALSAAAQEAAPPTPEKPICTISDLAALLNKKHGEVPYVVAKSLGGWLVIIFTNPSEGSWTIAVRNPKQPCIRVVDAGEDGSWQLGSPARILHLPDKPQAGGPAMYTGFILAHGMYDGLTLRYSTETANGRGHAYLNCCADNDCKPYPHRASAGLTAFEIEVNGQWYPVDTDKITERPASDGNVHACCSGGQCDAVTTPNFRCFMVPGAGALNEWMQKRLA